MAGRRGSRERGSSAIEFAILVLPLAWIIFGIIDYGMLLSFRQTMSQATSEGARAAAVAQFGAVSPNDPVTLAYNAIGAALGSNYSCTGGSLGTAGTLKLSGTAVGTCMVSSSPSTCVSGSPCTYSVTVVYNYASNPKIATVLVPMPSTITYTSAALGNT